MLANDVSGIKDTQTQLVDQVHQLPDTIGNLLSRYPYGAGLRPSILDLVCMDNNLYHRMTEFIIDEDNINEIRSDHRLVSMMFHLQEYYTPAKYVQWQPQFKIQPQSHEDFSGRLD